MEAVSAGFAGATPRSEARGFSDFLARWWFVALVALMWLVSPLLAGTATIATPNAPSMFFSMCAMACALVIVRDSSGESRHISLWISFGLFCGLALLSKYTTILLPGSVFLALLFSKSGRTHLTSCRRSCVLHARPAERLGQQRWLAADGV